MNVFYIPSWYPSVANPIYGTFVQEQIGMLARLNPDWNLGVCLWGQGDPATMLWAREPVQNFRKIWNHRDTIPWTDSQNNLAHYHSPSLTWTRKIRMGNLQGLKRAAEMNFEKFKKRMGEVDVLHAQATWPGALLAHHLSKKYHVPYVVTIRMSPFPFPEFLDGDGKLKKFIDQALRKADRLIATSEHLKNRLAEFGLDAVVVNNPVDTDFFRPENGKARPLTLLTIGRMEKQKGIDVLIDALGLLGNDFTGQVRIGGDGQYLNAYKQLARNRGVEGRISWLGELSREQVRDEMQQCSFYVLPSRHETFGNVVLEAMACGKAVLATRCGGPEEIITQATGMLCENENPEDLAEKIKWMANNLPMFSDQGIRAYVVGNYSGQLFSEQMGKVYREVAKH
jgi:glycosyltransferase involved in cell wall biosynthesis